MSPIPTADEELIEQLAKLLTSERTVQDIQERLGISRSGVYRYMDRLADRGYLIGHSGRARPVRYRITNRLPQKP